MLNNSKTVDRSGWHHLYPFTSHFINRDGLRYHYLDEGSGDPVLMIHGNPTWSFFFRELVKGLSDRYRVIAPDHIGCGLSEKPDLDCYGYRLQNRVDDLYQFVGKLDLKKKLTLVVHDWGGMIGFAVALRQPEKIGRIVVLNTAAFLPPPRKRLPLRLQIIRNSDVLAELAVLGCNLFVLGALFMAPHQRLDRAVRTGLAAPYNSWHNRRATLMFVRDIPMSAADPSYAMVRDVDKNLHRLKHLPMLICWGKHDFVFDLDYLEEWRRRFPEAQVHVLPDAGHYLLEDAPKTVLALVKRFLQRHPL
jgi:haloalkane dehalogenase